MTLAGGHIPRPDDNDQQAPPPLSPRRQNFINSASPFPDPQAGSHTDLPLCTQPSAGDTVMQEGAERRGEEEKVNPSRSDRDSLPERRISDEAENSSRSSSKQSLKGKGDSGEGGGNETDVEDEDGEADDSPTTGDDLLERALRGARPPSPPGTAMYPYPATELHRHHHPPSSAEVLLSSMTSSSSLDASDREDNDDDRRREPKRRRSLAWPGSPLGPNYRPGAVPPRARRIGALGISVHSDSDPDNPNISGLDSFDRRVEHTGDTTSDTRATDLGLSSGDLRQMGAMSPAKASGSRRCKTVAEATFRGVVDELAEQNRMMRERLKRYEAAAVPLELKRNRLFEIRFFDGLPPKRRAELEEFLAAYVQTLATDDDLPETDAPRPIASAVPQQMQDDYLTRANLAGPSNSGPEPQSLSGTGAGMRLPPSQSHIPNLLVEPTAALPITSPNEMAKALEVVHALEDLFEHSLERASKPAASADAASNEVYFANLLSNDFLSRGFVYLNLALTMAQIYRYNVTVNFVQRAVAQFSKRLELSDDGSRVRWKVASPLPHSPTRPALTEASVVANAAAVEEGQTSSGESLSAIKGRIPSMQIETDSRSGSGSGSGSSSLQQPSNLLAKSIAQSASTAPTSVPSSGRASLQQQQHLKGGPRPRRPTAAVLQPMHYFRTDSNAVAAVSKMPTAPAAVVCPSPRLQQTLPLPSPAMESVSSTGSAGQVLSATNLREHDRLQAGAAAGASSRGRLSTPQNSHDAQGSRRLQSAGGAGTLVFYKTGQFCTDLTTEAEAITPPALPPRVLEPDHPGSLVLGLDANDPPSASNPTSSGGENDIEMSVANDEGLKLLTGPAQSSQSGSDSHASSLARLQASGMTDAIPSDLFTIVVNTRQVLNKRPLDDPSPETDVSLPSPDAAGFPFFPAAYKRPRLDRNVSSLEVISTKEIRHEAKIAERNALELAGLAVESSSEGDKSPEEWTYGQVLTRTNLSMHARQPDLGYPGRLRPRHVPRDLSITPSPPHDDYLISLAAPSHAWAPVESGFHSSGRSNAATEPTLYKRRIPLARVGESRTNGSLSTGDERPISLDELVEVPHAPMA
ncbi:hypothetical protein JCM10908_007163 [Rhodotorula pacifica]|uniref:uncharacterized protein n=1 Tax=Rhodotorula pacifica TaxID=1495444 RepID=UPI003172B66C